MKKFFCDIRGTFINEDNVNNPKELIELSNNLKMLASLEEQDDILFSFITSDNKEFLKENIAVVLPYFENFGIKMGEHFAGEEKYNAYNNMTSNSIGGKSLQIVNEIDDNVSTVYFADDCYLYHSILEHICEKRKDNCKVVHFVLGNNNNNKNEKDNYYFSEGKGLASLNKLLQAHIEAKNVKKR